MGFRRECFYPDALHWHQALQWVPSSASCEQSYDDLGYALGRRLFFIFDFLQLLMKPSGTSSNLSMKHVYPTHLLTPQRTLSPPWPKISPLLSTKSTQLAREKLRRPTRTYSTIITTRLSPRHRQSLTSLMVAQLSETTRSGPFSTAPSMSPSSTTTALAHQTTSPTSLRP